MEYVGLLGYKHGFGGPRCPLLSRQPDAMASQKSIIGKDDRARVNILGSIAAIPPDIYQLPRCGSSEAIGVGERCEGFLASDLVILCGPVGRHPPTRTIAQMIYTYERLTPGQISLFW